MNLGLQWGLCRWTWACCICPDRHSLCMLTGMTFPYLGIILVERKPGHRDLRWGQGRRRCCKCSAQTSPNLDGGETRMMICATKYTWFTGEAYPTLTNLQKALGYGANESTVDLSSLYLSTIYKYRTIISVLNKYWKKSPVLQNKCFRLLILSLYGCSSHFLLSKCHLANFKRV